MKTEGLQRFIGRDEAGSLKRGVALASVFARYSTEQLANQTEILKQRRKAREEAQNGQQGKHT